MNTNQHKVLIGIIVAIAAMLLYPPYNYSMSSGRGGMRVYNGGYSWIFDAPTSMHTVNIGLLLTQWIAVVIVGATLYFVFKDKT